MPIFEKLFATGDSGGGKGTVERTMEIEKVPMYRYFYHGTFAGNLGEIEENGFDFKEWHPTLSISPHYCLRGWTGSETLKDRGRETSLEGDEGMLLVIEPEEYQVLSAGNDGAPVELEDGIIFTRGRWFNYHQALVKDAASKQEKHPGNLPPDQIKMALEPTGNLRNIFNNFRKELAQGNTPEDEYILQLIKYLESGEGVLLDKLENKQELAENMITGELQQYLIESIRRISLNIKFYKGDKIVQGREKKDFKPWPREKVDRVIASLKNISPINKFLKRYIDFNLPDLEREWSSV